MNNITFTTDPMMPSYPTQAIIGNCGNPTQTNSQYYVTMLYFLFVIFIGILVSVAVGVTTFFVVNLMLDTFGKWIGTLLVLSSYVIVGLLFVAHIQTASKRLDDEIDNNVRVF